MKKTYVLALALVPLLSLVGCNNQPEEEKGIST